MAIHGALAMKRAKQLFAVHEEVVRYDKGLEIIIIGPSADLGLHGPRHGALRMELSPKSEQLIQPQRGHSHAADTQPHALILLCASALQQWLGYSTQPYTAQTRY